MASAWMELTAITVRVCLDTKESTVRPVSLHEKIFFYLFGVRGRKMMTPVLNGTSAEVQTIYSEFKQIVCDFQGRLWTLRILNKQKQNWGRGGDSQS